MPLSKVTAVEVRPWTDKNNGNIARMAFRFTYEEIVPDPKVAFMKRFKGELNPRYITLFPDRNKSLNVQLEQEIAMKDYVDKGPQSFPNSFVMSYKQEVLPYCRAYSQNTKNHQIGDLMRDANGIPRLFDTITIHCEAEVVDGKEVPVNPSNVRYQAEQQRNWYINNDDSNGIRRFFEPAAVMDYVPEAAPEDDPNEIPVDAIAPPATPPVTENKPKFDPNTGLPIV